jgi:hypothetical protein
MNTLDSRRRPLFALAAMAWLAVPIIACGTSAQTGLDAQSGGNDGAQGADTGAGPDAQAPADTGVVPDAGLVADAGAPDLGTIDAGPPDSGLDHGSPSTTYPAFQVDVGQIVRNGGPVLTQPVIVTITWAADPGESDYQRFGDMIGFSNYWHTLNSEYGIGTATSGPANHVSIKTAPPPSISDAQLDTLVSTSAGALWPSPTANTIYAIYLPPGTTLTSGGQDICRFGVLGYHEETQDRGLVYAIMPHCRRLSVADMEDTASHELDEASTDPHPNTHAGFVGFDADHLAYEFSLDFMDEVGDVCASMDPTADQDTVDFPTFTVQRQWSNKSATAGSHWCVPSIDEPFFNTTFLPNTGLDDIHLSAGSTVAIVSKGFKIALNETRTFPIGFFSDRATEGPFSITPDMMGLVLSDQNGNPVDNGTANVTIDKTSGVNGEIAWVTVTPTAFNSMGFVYVVIRAEHSGSMQVNSLPFIVSSQ